jgi:pseudaminic acid biosynthesis-associated methylase
MSDELPSAEAVRLEGLWAGEFGDAYAERNRVLNDQRAVFWGDLLSRYPIRSVLEVGCGQGNNLRPISSILDPRDVWGVDVNDGALARARSNAPGVNVVAANARRLPFRDGLVDLAFTVGVLIHQPDASLPIVISEIVRCSRRYVVWIEYNSDRTEEVPYHGEPGTLIKRDFGGIYRELFPELRVLGQAEGTSEDGMAGATWQLLEKP